MQQPGGVVGQAEMAGVMAKAEVSSATTMSQDSTRSSAPPQTVPWIMAITGAGQARMARSARSSGSA